MARFDVHELKGRKDLVIDCQADLLDRLTTRFVVPLALESEAPRPAARLNPTFKIGNRQYVMMTQFAAAIHLRELGPVTASLRGEGTRIVDALDLLITGI